MKVQIQWAAMRKTICEYPIKIGLWKRTIGLARRVHVHIINPYMLVQKTC